MNKKLQVIEEAAIELMDRHGLIEDGWSFKWNRRTKSVGLCNGTNQVISLSKILTPERSGDDIRNTILHEIAHALVGIGNNHNHRWRAKFIEIGGDGERTASDLVGNMVGVKWVLKGSDGVVYKHYSRKPNKRTIESVQHLYPAGRRDLMGSLQFEKVIL